MSVNLKACPFCKQNLIEKQDDMGGVWYEHIDRMPYSLFTYKTNIESGKSCLLSNFTLDYEEIERWNTRHEPKEKL